MNEIVKQETAVKEWSGDEIKLIQQTVAKNATPQEFKLFLYTAKHYNLDPLVKQIWFVKYKASEPGTIFAGRDGFLSIAHRSGQFDGMETVAIRDDKNNLRGAKCTIWRKDMSHPISVEVSMSEYSKPYGNWKSMPETMIKKVAQSQALRQAFDISGIYSPEEDWHKEEDAKPEVIEQEAEVIENDFDSIPENPQIKDDTQKLRDPEIEAIKEQIDIYAMVNDMQYADAEAHVLSAFCTSKGITGVNTLSDLNIEQALTLDKQLRRKLKQMSKGE